MRLTSEVARRLFAGAAFARLATVRQDGAPHIVPITFAVVGEGGDAGGDAVVFAVDHKPKSTTVLQRLTNIAAEPRVSLLADHEDANWSNLWWVRADATADVVTSESGRAAALRALAAKYPDYLAHPPEHAVVRCVVRRWSGWSAANVPPGRATTSPPTSTP